MRTYTDTLQKHYFTYFGRDFLLVSIQRVFNVLVALALNNMVEY